MLGSHVKFTECGGKMPIPPSGIKVGGPSASLVIVMLPPAIPVAAGANTTFNVADCPGARIMPEGTPPASKAGAETLTFEIVTYDPLVLVIVTLAALAVPTLTAPKLNPFAGSKVNRPGVELTESMAGLLVTLPTALLTTTVNNDPSSVIATAGDV